MYDGDIDYSKYGLSELEEALAKINRQLYPKNYENLCAAYFLIAKKYPTEKPVASTPQPIKTEASWTGPSYYENGRYLPNEIPPKKRNFYIIFSIILFSYGSYGAWKNDLYVPGKRRGIHLHDVPAWIMYGAIICACVVMASVVIDHYDRRNNEISYRAFAKAGEYIGWSLFGASLIWYVIY
ncbi:MAG: hypothetical protein RIQ43_1467 [Pseudomonadota bacterium]|jgi:hypothetical protein